MTDSKIKSALDAAGTAADYSARATYQRGYDAGVESMDAFWKSRDTESQIAIGDARYEAKAAQQMVAELRAAIQDMFDKAPSLTPSDAEWKAAAVASLAARKLLTLSAPIADRWCLASDRDAATARAEKAEAAVLRCWCRNAKTDGAHTPGTWDCSTSDDTQSFPLDVWVTVDTPRRHMKIATVYQTGVRGEAQANAALIAAAPETRARAIAAERRESELGLQVVAQAARLKLAEAVVDEARGVIKGADPAYGLIDALAAWDDVPGDDNKEKT